MQRHGWTRVVLSVVMTALFAKVGIAQDASQDSSKDEQIQDLKRRLELLEKDKEARDAVTPGAAVTSDPVEEKWYDKVHVGGGIRTEYRAEEIPVGAGKKYTSDFNIDNARLYVGGKINDWLSATLDAEFAAAPSVLDAIAQAKFSNELNIYMGRLLPATDRSNFDGPFYLSTWDFPFLSDSFNSAGQLADRDNGMTIWGDVDHFKYWVGAYEGNQHGGPNARIGDRLLYAARVQYDFFDAETGYYLQSTYYGDTRILAVGFVANYQGSAAGTTANPKPFGNACVDVLWEDKVGEGVMTVEADYYYFGRHGFGVAQETGVGAFDTGAGTGTLLSVAYLIHGQVGWGQFQPVIRYQAYNDATSGIPRNVVDTSIVRLDIGVNYVMVGHNARLSLVYTRTDVDGRLFGGVVLGTQFQF
ncbi:MAG TPA: hypothetical protein VMU54_09660 [Planctomycetota bacterium]|nr:hypothetical protein [Planctomycetota bacterium]